MTENYRAAIAAAPIAQRRHRAVMLAVFGCVLAALPVTEHRDLLEAPLVAACLIIIFGLPHGALDVMVAGMSRNLETAFALLNFLAQYLALAVLVAVWWWFFPSFALVAFLAISAVHFGGDWNDAFGRLGQGVIGAALLSSTALNHEAQVAEIFGWLTPLETAGIVSQALHMLAPFALGGAGVALVSQVRRRPLATCEAAATITCAICLPPITFFVLYFCLLHSVRHLLATRDALWRFSSQDLMLRGAPYALLATAFCLIGSAAFLHLGPGRAMLSSVFVVLSAFTVPHMLLVDWARPSVSRH